VAATVEKVSVALGLDDLAWLRERAEQQRASLSAVLTAAIRTTREREALHERQRASLEAYVNWATDGKGLPPEVVADAERELDELTAK
jgi:Arc/MetJ-type ribon-helix-helix transcriptional regulator